MPWSQEQWHSWVVKESELGCGDGAGRRRRFLPEEVRCGLGRQPSPAGRDLLNVPLVYCVGCKSGRWWYSRSGGHLVLAFEIPKAIKSRCPAETRVEGKGAQTMFGIRAYPEYDSLLRLTKSISNPPSCIIVVSRGLEFSGLPWILVTSPSSQPQWCSFTLLKWNSPVAKS